MSLGALEVVTCSGSNGLMLSWFEPPELQVPQETQPFGQHKPHNSWPCWSDKRKSDGLPPPEMQLEQGARLPPIFWERDFGGGKILPLASASPQNFCGFNSTWCLGPRPTPREGCHLLNSRFCCLQHLYFPISHPKRWPNPSFYCKESVMAKLPAWHEVTAAWHLLTDVIFLFVASIRNVYLNTLIIRDGNKSEDNNSPHSIAIIWPWSKTFTVSAKTFCWGFLCKFTINWCDISVPVSQNLEVSLKRNKPIRLLTLPTGCSNEFHQRLSRKKIQLSFHKYGWNKVYKIYLPHKIFYSFQDDWNFRSLHGFFF